jgi:hypothetical protein
VIGGHDYDSKCATGQTYGHAVIRQLDTSVHDPVWSQLPAGVVLNRERWYPTVISLANGDSSFRVMG